MNEILKLFISLSVSGSILALVLFAIKPLVKNRLSKQWQYYIWLIVILRFLIPFSPEVSVVGSFSNYVESRSSLSTVSDGQAPVTAEYLTDTPIVRPETSNERTDIIPRETSVYWQEIKEHIWLIWLGVAILLLVRKVTGYHRFVRYVKAGTYRVEEEKLLNICQEVSLSFGLKKSLPVYVNQLVASPMLVGIFRPIIIIPSLNMSNDELRNIIKHELTHYRRLDIIYKWMVQISVCVHWFNPLLYMISREINRACELSCDEAIINTIDETGRLQYGDTLLSTLRTNGTYSDTIVSITLSENTALLKERLGAIMVFRKKTKYVAAVSVALSLFMFCGAAYVGAYSIAEASPYQGATSFSESNNALPDVDAANITAVTLNAASCGVKVEGIEGNAFTFDYLGLEDTSKFAASYQIVNNVLQITVDGSAARTAGGHYYVNNTGPAYVNTIQIGVPDKVYTDFSITLLEAPITLPDINASVQIDSDHGTIDLIDTIISNGNYRITNASGGVLISADTIRSNIAVNNNGSFELVFNKPPEHLSLDVSACTGQIALPHNWSGTYTIGDGTPVIDVANSGLTTVTTNN